jgi:hypothetical protein
VHRDIIFSTYFNSFFYGSILDSYRDNLIVLGGQSCSSCWDVRIACNRASRRTVVTSRQFPLPEQVRCSTNLDDVPTGWCSPHLGR